MGVSITKEGWAGSFTVRASTASNFRPSLETEEAMTRYPFGLVSAEQSAGGRSVPASPLLMRGEGRGVLDCRTVGTEVMRREQAGRSIAGLGRLNGRDPSLS
jgi:hypothetical protein